LGACADDDVARVLVAGEVDRVGDADRAVVARLAVIAPPHHAPALGGLGLEAEPGAVAEQQVLRLHPPDLDAARPIRPLSLLHLVVLLSPPPGKIAVDQDAILALAKTRLVKPS